MTQSVKHFADVPSPTTTQIDYLLLDGSSSMYDQWWDVLAALDAYVDGTKRDGIDTKIILATFDGSEVQCVQREVPIRDWQSLVENPIGNFGGGTPLYDAIAAMGRSLRDINPPKASIVIATDGAENGSRFTDVTQARAIIKWMEAKGWQVTFIGCNWNNSGLADALGVSASAAIGVEKRHLTSAAKSLAKKRTQYARSGAPMHWSDDEKQQFGGYLA